MAQETFFRSGERPTAPGADPCPSSRVVPALTSATDVSAQLPWTYCAIVLLLTFIAYLGTLQFDFVHDDRTQILDNVLLRSWHYLPGYFTTHLWAFKPDLPRNYYRPLFLLWLRLNYVLFGLKPWGWHLTTVLAHVGVTFFVFQLGKRILQDGRGGLLAAAIFGLHPIHIEAVAWISGSAETLVALALIPSYLCFLNSRERASRRSAWLVLSLGLYLLGIFLKENALALPALILFTGGLWGHRESSRGWSPWLERLWAGCKAVLPFAAVTVPYLIARVIVLKAFEHPIPLSVRTMVMTWPSLLWFYVKLLIWPAGLCPFYALKYVIQPDIQNCGLPAIMVGAVAAGLGWLGWRSRKAALAASWLALPALPLLNIQILGERNLAHNRYLYLPSIGFALLAALALRRVRIGKGSLLSYPAAQTGLVLPLICALGVSTSNQSACYASDAVFYDAIYKVFGPSDPVNLMNLANVRAERGEYDAADQLYQQVLRRTPDFWLANYNLGYMNYARGRLPEAERYLTLALQGNPRAPDAFFYLGLTRFKMGRAEEAAADVRRALSLAPEALNYHFALGVILETQGELQAAEQEFREELAHHPDQAAAREKIHQIEKRRRAEQKAPLP